jgi:RNA polymerase sigma-70 factor (ECF subfamily)
MELDGLSDEVLLTRSGAGCEQSFTALYRRHQGRIYRFAYEMSGSKSIAEEATQEVFLAMLSGDCGYDAGRGRLAPFLMGMARNKVLQRLRGSARFAELAEDGVVSPATGAVDDLDRRDTADAVRRAVLALPEQYREVVAMCDLEEMEYAEAAEALGCPVGTVRSRLHRGRALLAEKLSSTGVARSLA